MIHQRHVPPLLLSLLLTSACSSQPSASQQAETDAGANICQDPRPEVCTQNYAPVCATLHDGTTADYPNGCGACADSKVVSWVDGACTE